MLAIGNNIKSGLDYTPFGMLIPNRTYNKIPNCEPVVTNQVVDIINEDYSDDKGGWVDGQIEFDVNGELLAEVDSENNNSAIAGRVYTTVIGEEYTISFDVTDLSGLNGASLLVYHTEFDGSTFDEVTTVVPSQNPFEITIEDEYTFTVTAGTELLAFNLLVAGSSSVVGSTFTIDNFIITGPQQIRTFNCAGDNYLAINYRYGFNGMEKDDEVSGEGNAYTTEYRGYDPRTGRWRSLDPLMNQFPWMSPYVSMDNNPIALNDPLGLSTGTEESIGLQTKDGKDLPPTIVLDEIEVTAKRIVTKTNEYGIADNTRNSVNLNSLPTNYSTNSNPITLQKVRDVLGNNFLGATKEANADMLNLMNKNFVMGGDGRFYLRNANQTVQDVNETGGLAKASKFAGRLDLGLDVVLVIADGFVVLEAIVKGRDNEIADKTQTLIIDGSGALIGYYFPGVGLAMVTYEIVANSSHYRPQLLQGSIETLNRVRKKYGNNPLIYPYKPDYQRAIKSYYKYCNCYPTNLQGLSFDNQTK
jgi:RHS repeat-associated protein